MANHRHKKKREDKNLVFEHVTLEYEETLLAHDRAHSAKDRDGDERYGLEDVMQAVCAALLWGEDASEACACRIQGDYSEHRPIGESVTVVLGGLQTLTLSSTAADLLCRAHYESKWRGAGIVHPATGLSRHDLRDWA